MVIDMRRRVICLALALAMVLSVCACGKEKEKVSLTVWIPDTEEQMIEVAIEEFKKANAKEADFEIKIEFESVDGVKQTVLTNIEAAADVYNFASDQFYDLYSNGALYKLNNADSVIDACGGKDAAIIKNASENGDLYAFPMTNSNGYFMYYNSDYFKVSDVKNLNTMLEVAASKGKKVAMDWNSGWYLYSFFAGAGKGVKLDDARSKNICDFNSQEGTFKGTDVAQAMLDIATSKGFKAVISADFINEVKSGSVVALVSGAWNATALKEIWGDSLAAVRLPEYNIADTSVQMRSFAGFKYMGVNPKSKNVEWAAKLAQYLTSKEQQEARFKTTGECPANVEAANSDEVKASPAISALVKQAAFADVQDVGENFWTPMSKLGVYLASGNPDKVDLQKLLDDTVKEIEG